MKVFITAQSGVGKTTVTDELVRRGYTAFDTDNVPGMARLELRETGQPVEWPVSGYIDWKKYGWNIQGGVLDEVLSRGETVFLSGICGNQDEFYSKFDKLVVLTVEHDEYLRRMRTRPHRGASDEEINIQQRIGKYATKLQQFIDSGFVTVDNSGAVEQTVDQILSIVYEK